MSDEQSETTETTEAPAETPAETETIPEPEATVEVSDVPTSAAGVTDAENTSTVTPAASETTVNTSLNEPEQDQKFRIVHQTHNAGDPNPHSVVTSAAETAEDAVKILAVRSGLVGELIDALKTLL